MRIFSLLLLCFSTTVCAQTLEAELQCRLTRTDFVYDCIIRIARAGRPLAGVQLTVGADMPSMPGAHNTAPVKAQPSGAAGEYKAQLDLEMLGEWAVSLQLAGPVSERLVLRYDFDEKGARPVIRSGKLPRK